jgi:hypothetical protein
MRRLAFLVFVVLPVAFVVYVFAATPDPPAQAAPAVDVTQPYPADAQGQALVEMQQVTSRVQVVHDAFAERQAWLKRRWQFGKAKLECVRSAISDELAVLSGG